MIPVQVSLNTTTDCQNVDGLDKAMRSPNHKI